MKRLYISILIIAGMLSGILVLSSCDGQTVPTGDDSTNGEQTVPTGDDTADTDRILILYDNAGPYGHVGKDHAILLTNLLGHFDLPISCKPASQYVQGEVELQSATFYIGATFDEQSYYDSNSLEFQNYNHFLTDAAETDANLIWINYNIDRLQELVDAGAGLTFSEKFGFDNVGVLDNLYNRITYKETELYKGVIPFANPGEILTVCVEEGENTYACSTELNVIDILDDSKATAYAHAYSTLTSAELTPYITRSGNFWFVGDLPFTYMSEEDRYLAFADVLHDMLEIQHVESHSALVRLEDVSANSNAEDIRNASDYLIQNSIPFSVAVIPQYREGTTDGPDLWLSETGQYLKELYLADWASIIAHGYTHQREALANPYNGISGEDFEFYRVTENSDNSLNFLGPIEPDTESENLNRMERAVSILNRAGLQPFAWEVPHYIASENSYLGILELFPIHYGRMVYFNNADDTTQRMVVQFFPYIIGQDLYGYNVIPENLGNIVPDPIEGYRAVLPEDLIRQAGKALVVRDGYASFFYHPYLGTDYLQQVVEGLQNLGYTFVAADSLN